jgi:hypothetical protein
MAGGFPAQASISAAILEESVIEKILRHLEEDPQAPRAGAAAAATGRQGSLGK